jgi:hypothetical protein
VAPMFMPDNLTGNLPPCGWLEKWLPLLMDF